MKFSGVVLLMVILVSLGHGGVKGDSSKKNTRSINTIINTLVKPGKASIMSLLKYFNLFFNDMSEPGKDIVFGKPFEVAMPLMDSLCQIVLKGNSKFPFIDPPDINDMYFQLRTACKNYTEPFLRAEKLWNNPNFDPNKKVVIVVPGWLDTIERSNILSALSKAYNCRADVNFVAVEPAYFQGSYIHSAHNTKITGEFLAKGLVKLNKVVGAENIHLIGFSLGARVVSAAASYFHQATGKKISRVTALDPANPCFDSSPTFLAMGADFVDVIHSNPNVFGQPKSRGHIDFYVNGLDSLQNGCTHNFCAHHRAWQYYAESVYPGNEQNFKGVFCSSWDNLESKECAGKEATMGYAVKHRESGMYLVETSSKPPYGMNAKNPSAFYLTDQCGKCVC